MTITICIGSSCHLKGSRQIIQRLTQLINESGNSARIQLSGSFCMNNCAYGVSVKIGEELFSVQPDNVDKFFEEEVLRRL